MDQENASDKNSHRGDEKGCRPVAVMKKSAADNWLHRGDHKKRFSLFAHTSALDDPHRIDRPLIGKCKR
jgi:hypothetical protein